MSAMSIMRKRGCLYTMILQHCHSCHFRNYLCMQCWLICSQHVHFRSGSVPPPPLSNSFRRHCHYQCTFGAGPVYEIKVTWQNYILPMHDGCKQLTSTYRPKGKGIACHQKCRTINYSASVNTQSIALENLLTN